MEINTIIVDNFLDNPYVVRESALALDMPNTGSFPGTRSDRADDDYAEYIKRKLEAILHRNIIGWEQDSLQFQLCLDGDNTWIHCDKTEWAAVLYLTPDAPVGAGTALYRHKETGQYSGPVFPDSIDVGDVEAWEPHAALGNVFNRIVIYRGTLFHRSIIPGFGKTKETGRLTQVFFFNTTDE